MERNAERGSGITDKPLKNDGESGIINLKKTTSRNFPNGLRRKPNHYLTTSEIEKLQKDILAIKADEKIFKFNCGSRTGYNDDLDKIMVKGDVLPDSNSNHPRDRMSSRAVFAHGIMDTEFIVVQNLIKEHGTMNFEQVIRRQRIVRI